MDDTWEYGILKSRIWLIKPDVRLLVISGTNKPNVSRREHFYIQQLKIGMDKPFQIV